MTQPLLGQLDAEFSSVGSEYFINSQELEDKVRKLLPSQGGAGAGFDLSASTQILPIIDLTESAEGSNVRADLQTALSFGTITAYTVQNNNPTLVSNTGYFRIFGVVTMTGGGDVIFNVTDGASTKVIKQYIGSAGVVYAEPYDFNIFLEAGESFNISSTTASVVAIGNSRQIA